MLPPERDPWSPQGPRAKDPPRKEPPREEPSQPFGLDDAPAPADREVVLVWNGRPRVRVHLAVGNWHADQSYEASRQPRTLGFSAWWNIGLELTLACHGTCETSELPANLAKRARTDAREMRMEGLAPRFIVAPHHDGDIWGWKLVGRDRTGAIGGGMVTVDRVLPALGGFLECVGKTESGVDPAWLDRMDEICRQMTVEILP